MHKLPMKQFIIHILFLLFMFFQAQAQSSSPSKGNFQPSLVVVIVVLTSMFSLSIVLLIYAKYCHRTSRPLHNINHQNTLDGLFRVGSRFSGIDKKIVESLPLFRFSLLKGSREGLECAVCLSKFEDIEILRLLPKCKHAFHIDCVDQWLETHSSCPLCRQKVSIDDMSLTYSSSLRFLMNPSRLREGSNIDFFVQRVESHQGSSRFSIGNSFRKIEKGMKEEEFLIQENFEDFDEEKGNMLHRFNHMIIVSNFMFKNRWSNVSSSDLMFLNSEMINSISSDRFSTFDMNKNKHSMRIQENEEGEIMNIEDEMERRRVFEHKLSKTEAFDLNTNGNNGSRILNPSQKRSMSEITVHPRSRDFIIKGSIRESHCNIDTTKEEKMKRLWYRIARRTAEWFVNREKRSQPNRSYTLNV